MQQENFWPEDYLHVDGTLENAQPSNCMDLKEHEAEVEDSPGKNQNVSSQVVHGNEVMETRVHQFDSSMRRPSFRK